MAREIGAKMNSLVFNQDLFVNRSTRALSDYCESLLSNEDFVLNENQITWLANQLDIFDESHTVYAILLLAKQKPIIIKDRIPELLALQSDSIRAACLNVLSDWPCDLCDIEYLDNLRPILNNERFGVYGVELFNRLKDKSCQNDQPENS